MANLRNPQLDHLKSVSTVMDSQFKGPLGIRFGLDAILGFIPIVGDFVTTAVSLYIIIQAAGMGCTPSTIIRMAINLLIESVIDIIPVLGSFFDIFWRANDKNLALLEEHLIHPQRVTWKSRIIIFLIVLMLIGIMALGILLAVKLFSLILSMIR